MKKSLAAGAILFAMGTFAYADSSNALVCTYSYQRNSQDPQKRKSETELAPQQQMPLDSMPNPGGQRARISQSVALDGHRLAMSAMLVDSRVTSGDRLNLFVLDETVDAGTGPIAGASAAGVSAVQVGQKLKAQYNFSPEPGVVTLVFMECGITE